MLLDAKKLLGQRRPRNIAKRQRTSFKNCKLGDQTLSRYNQEACNALGIKGDDGMEYLTRNGIRETDISMLFEAGFEKEAVSIM